MLKSGNRIIIIIVHNFRGHVNILIYTEWGARGCVSVAVQRKYWRKALFSAAQYAWLLDFHTLPYSKKRILCSLDRASYYMAIIIQQDATEYSSFKSVNCLKYFGWYFAHHQELITVSILYVIYEILTVVTV